MMNRGITDVGSGKVTLGAHWLLVRQGLGTIQQFNDFAGKVAINPLSIYPV